MLYCILQFYAMICTHIWAVFTADCWFRFNLRYVFSVLTKTILFLCCLLLLSSQSVWFLQSDAKRLARRSISEIIYFVLSGIKKIWNQSSNAAHKWASQKILPLLSSPVLSVNPGLFSSQFLCRKLNKNKKVLLQLLTSKRLRLFTKAYT